MLDPQTLRGRLALSYTLALVLSIILFGALALAVIDRAQRAALDAQLNTSARAILAIVDGQQGRVTIDEADTVRLSDLLGAKANGVVWQRDGAVAATSGRGAFPGLRTLALTAKAPRFASLHGWSEEVRAYLAPVVTGGKTIGALAIWRETDAIGALDRAVALAFALAIPVLAAIAVLFGGAIARRALAPLGRIAALASEIEAHDLSSRLALPSRRDELGQLAATFDRMLDRLQSAFERERRFTSDASHELRAPLSVIRAEADLALRRERSSEEYRNALRAIADGADALEAITRELLSAARADVDTGGRAILALGALASDAATQLAVLAAQRGLTIDVRTDEGVHVRADREALTRAIVAVLHNAIKYASDAGHVQLDVIREGAIVELRVTDDGPGFSSGAFEHAFERFWRGDEVRAREGSGLGLAIVRSIVTANGGTVAIGNVVGGGAVVHMRFSWRPPSEASSSCDGSIAKA